MEMTRRELLRYAAYASGLVGGGWNNAMQYYVPPPSAPLFADMKKAGYRTAQIGKLHWYSGSAYKREFDDPEACFKALGIDHRESVSLEGKGRCVERLKKTGRVVEAVKKRGAWDNALVVFAADHGEMMGAHGAFSKGRFYDESARVPLVMRWPERIRPGTRVEAPVQRFDIYPTIVEAGGGGINPGHFAKFAWPLLDGSRETRPAVFSEISHKGELRYMARTRRHKWFIPDNEEQLYDLEKDPYEQKDLIGNPAHRGVTEETHERLREFLMTAQVNVSADYKPKVQRMREKKAKEEQHE